MARELKNAENNLLAKLGRNLDKSSLQSVKIILQNLENLEKLEIMDDKIIDEVEGYLKKERKK